MVDAEEGKSSEGVAEKDRPNGEEAYSAGDGEMDGDGEESLVKGGELDRLLLSVVDEGLNSNLGGLNCC